MKIYHNPRCKKSRTGLQYLQEKGINPEIILYLKDQPFTVESLTNLVKKTGLKPLELIRTQEADYKKNFKGKTFTDEQWIKIMCENPKFIQRPIVESEKNAILANPAENIENL